MNRWGLWWRENRDSARVAFALRLASTILGAGLSLVWTRLLVRALGAENYGTYQAFASFLGLSLAGELGMGGAVSIRTTELLAHNRLDELRALHATARRVFFRVSLGFGLVALLLSPWLPQWLHFQSLPSAGPLQLLFAIGAINVALNIYNSYVGNALYGAGTVMWPIMPLFLMGQATLACQVVLAMAHAPLWLMHGAVTLLGLAGLGVSLLLYRHSHPVFAEKLRGEGNSHWMRELARTSAWSYVFGIGFLIYGNTDRLVVNAFIGAAQVSTYHFNIRLADLMSTLVIAAAGAAMPKVVVHLLADDEAVRGRGEQATWHLARFQGWLAVAFGLGYLWVNDLFVGWFFGASFRGPIMLQAAFATSMVLTATAGIFVELAGRLSMKGLRCAALAIVATAVLNLALSVLAGKQGWLAGVGWATCAAQTLLGVTLAAYVRRGGAFAASAWTFARMLLAPLCTLALGVFLRMQIGVDTWQNAALLLASYAGLLLIHMGLIGPGWRELRREVLLGLQRFGIGRST